MPDHPPRPHSTPAAPIGELLERLANARLDGDPATVVRGVTQDSRAVQPGDLYIARAGEHSHGIDHVDAAVAAGAVAALTDPGSAPKARAAGLAVVIVDDPQAATGPTAAWVYGDPARGLRMIGVTGTNGKTTTGYLLDAGLRKAGVRTGLIGTIETRIAGEALGSAHTTPEATDLQALLAVMREYDVDAVTMEVSSHALRLGRVDAVLFDLAIFTNLSQDHLDFHADMEDYFAAKAALFTPQRSRRAVVCIDDDWGRRLAASSTVPTTTVGRSTEADWRLAEEWPAAGASPGRLRLVDPAGVDHDLTCRLSGVVNLTNAALGYVGLVEAGVDPELARLGIGELEGVPGRMERVDAGQPFVVIVDYAHTPGAVNALLADAHRLAAPAGRVLVVLGCGGDRDRAKRPLMGASAATGADAAWLTSDNPRSEDPQAILAAMLEGVPAGAHVVVEPDRRRAIGAAIADARPGDVVVIAGKGHEQGQQVGEQVLPFDDRVVARAALGAGAGVS
jgi:UDP-N-acetylmuramoyl-L-alanyl-D-glutamate--2,6-diaminopimelate ligase